MYKTFSAADYKKPLSLPEDYSVEGLLCYGSWNRERFNRTAMETMTSLGVEFTIGKTEGFLQCVLEINIRGKVYWFTVMYGGALLSEIVHLASLFGSKGNLHIGSCGGLNPEIGDTELIVPSWSHGNESTTRTYEPEAKDFRHYADPTLAARLEGNLPEGHKVWHGPVITNQAMMGESFEDVKSWSEAGFYGVEMEVSTIFAVSKHFAVPAAALLFVADNLVRGQVVGDESHTGQSEKRRTVRDSIFRAALLTLIGN